MGMLFPICFGFYSGISSCIFLDSKAGVEGVSQLSLWFHRPDSLYLPFFGFANAQDLLEEMPSQCAGATVGVLPCLDISSSVTAFGRSMIDHTKKMVEAVF